MSFTAKRVLIAEDNPGSARVLQFNLESIGLDVTVADNGKQAWETAQREPYDMVITDHEMPEMSGLELIAHLRQLPQYTATPIIMITAREIELDTSRLRDSLSLSAILPKPYSPRELLRMVVGLLNLNQVPASG